ncbi:hypothetical protein [Luteolibacter soli]|uniref:Uncharacterized protein n=1 Tax=Luteolibacter soli TaxID=3135280 RepID=A0ABU9B158_9BACT
MKPWSMLAVAVAGFAAGSWLPSKSSASASPPVAVAVEAHRETRRQQRMNALADTVLEKSERWEHKKQAMPLAGLLTTFGRSYTDDDAARIAATDPVAALDQLLINPVSSGSFCNLVAAAWADAKPAEAIRYFLSKSNYRANDCLCEALKHGEQAEPELVAEVIRSKPRQWQLHYLDQLFGQTIRVKNPEASSGAGPSDQDDWIDRRLGENLLECLSDDGLRNKVHELWKLSEKEAAFIADRADPEPESIPDPAAASLANYERSKGGSRSTLFKRLEDHPEETLQEIAREGNLEARKAGMEHVLGEIPSRSPENWGPALEKLGAEVTRLGVIPEVPTTGFAEGPFLYGPVVGEWLDRQPLALRRSWAPAIVETWAQKNAPEAVAWAQALPEEASRDQAFQTGMIVWTHQDPSAAITHVEGLPEGDLREAAISNAAATWNCIDPTAARKWVEALPDSPGKQRALERLK